MQPKTKNDPQDGIPYDQTLRSAQIIQNFADRSPAVRLMRLEQNIWFIICVTIWISTLAAIWLWFTTDDNNYRDLAAVSFLFLMTSWGFAPGRNIAKK